MRFGMHISSDDPAEIGGRERVAQHVERAVAAYEAGFDTVALNHRYSYGPAQSDERGEPLSSWRLQALPLIAHISGHLGDRVNYLTAVLLSTSAQPVQLAEDMCTIDAMTGGRLTLGIGLGWMPYEFEAFGVSLRTRARRFEELLVSLRMLLSQDEVDFDGTYFRFRNARLVARPVQRPHPPIWVGASADPAVQRAARLGDAWVISSHITADELTRQQELFREEREAAGLPMPTDRPMNRVLYLGKDRESALKDALPMLTEWYRKRGTWGWFVTEDQIREEIESSGRWIIGGPDDCVEQITNLEDRLGITYITVNPGGGMNDHASRLRIIEILGDRVLPHFKQRSEVRA